MNSDNILTFNYIENDFFTSIEFIEMLAKLEQAYAITFEDKHLQSSTFSSVGGLINLIETLYMENQCVE